MINKTDIPEATRAKFEEFCVEFQTFTISSLFEYAVKGQKVLDYCNIILIASLCRD